MWSTSSEKKNVQTLEVRDQEISVSLDETQR